MFALVGDHALFVLVFMATSGLTAIHLLVLLARRATARKTPAPVPAPVEGERRLSVAFIVAVYNDELTIGPCVESILAQSRPADEIIVVDDGSTDGTPRVLDGLRQRGVRVYTMPKNGGKTRALEFALRMTRADLVSITDADSIVHRDYLKEMVPSFRDPEVAGVGGAVESIPHTWVTAARQVEYLLTLKVDRAAEDRMGTLIVLPGVSSTYRRDVLVDLGFEHDTIAEDFDLTFRMHAAGRKLGMNSRAIVYTSDPPTLRAYHAQLTRWYTDLWITVKKHRKLLGHKAFGIVEVPLLVVNMLAYSTLVIALPIALAIFAPGKLLIFFGWELVLDTALTVLAGIVYKRWNVGWAILSRAPTRFIARWVTIWTFLRVMVGRPGKAWVKLERRRTAGFYARERQRTTSE